MKNKNILFILLALFFAEQVFSQGSCGTYHGYLDDDREKYPEFYQSLETINHELEKEHQAIIEKLKSFKTNNNGKKIIPVVVHVIHDMGSENISDASIQGALDILNANINGQAANFLNKTPDVFAAVRGDLNVEFRLAKIDPNGNPTTGINRVRSSLTFEPEPRNSVKALSYWNSYSYFNIWTVKKFAPQSDGNTLLGFAQFPNSGSMSTDGVVLLASQMVSGGTLTHETGHWLGLRHVWGDSDCGDDDIADTPPAAEANFGVDLSDFPYHVGECIGDSMNWAGEMFVNYMDYSDDDDVTMFTKGQNVVMNQVLEGVDSSSIGYREYLWSDSNLINTGTIDGYKPAVCSQQSDFNYSAGTSSSVCIGQRIYLRGNKAMFGNGNVNSFVWDFGDGNTDNSGNNTINYTYSSEGTYNVSLTVVYDETTISTSSLLSDLDPTNAIIDSIISNKIVQGTQADLIAMGANSITEITLDSLGLYYGMQDSSYFRGTVKDVVYIAYYNNTCTTTVTKNDFIVIGPTTSNNSASDYSYDFESLSELTDEWNVVSSSDIESPWAFVSGKNSTWEWVSGLPEDNSCIKLTGDKIANRSHEIISPSYNLSGFNEPAIKFRYSGAAKNTFPENQLKVTYSNDCGESWTSLGELTAVETANAGLYATSFTPQADDWRSIIMKKTQLKDNNIRFKFEYVATESGGSNNFFIDDIEIGEESSLIVQSSSNLSRLNVFPNPAKNDITITIKELSGSDIELYIVNILGLKVGKIFSGRIDSDLQSIEVGLNKLDLDKGIYFVKVVNRGDIILTNKFVLE